MSEYVAIRRRSIALLGAVLLASTVTAGTVGVARATPADTSGPTPAHIVDTSTDLSEPDEFTTVTGRAESAAVLPQAQTRSNRLRPSTTLALTPRQLCGAQSNAPVPDGRPIVISLPPAKPFVVGTLRGSVWASPPTKDPAWRMWFNSFRWAQGVVLRATADGQTQSAKSIVDQVLRYYVDHRDPGTPSLGWDEGTSLRRLETLNCLYAATKDERLVDAMATEVRVQAGPRYYGPPRRAVHNHGLMANIRIITAGTLVGRADWVALGRKRIVAEAPMAFTASGTSIEQSAMYHQVNYQMWVNAANVLAVLDPLDPTPARIRATLTKAQRVTQWLTEPDGDLVQIGDSSRVAGLPAAAGRADTFRDDRAGMLVGRWSWTDPKTSYYTLRYGPPRWAHGHFDKGGVTWSAAGVRVLVGPGYTTYDATDPASPWNRQSVAHNTSAPITGRFDQRATAALRSSTFRGQRATAVIDDAVYGIAHRRTTHVDNAATSVSVTDSYARSTRNIQSWHLDPAWAVVSAPRAAKVLRFRHPNGKTLTIRTNGLTGLAVRGRARPQAGWHYPTTAQRVPAWQLAMYSVKGSVTTTFTVGR